jgi:hypothetical protein
MAKKKTTKKQNGQEWEPRYQFWHERDFWNDLYVSRSMTNLQRHFFRAMLQAAFYCSTRPNLPKDDNLLCALADAGSLEVWMENKPAIMSKFHETKMKVDGHWVEVWANKRLKRDWIKLLENSERQRNRRKGKTDSGDDFAPDLEAPENNEDDGIEGDADLL